MARSPSVRGRSGASRYWSCASARAAGLRGAPLEELGSVEADVVAEANVRDGAGAGLGANPRSGDAEQRAGGLRADERLGLTGHGHEVSGDERRELGRHRLEIR